MERLNGKRVLLLGATGLLGNYLAKLLPTRFETFAPIPYELLADYKPEGIRVLSHKFDAMHSEGLQDVIEEAMPNFIVNCIAITPKSPLANDEIACITVNGLFPHQLASLSRNYGMHVIHISTDGVFSGKRGNYRETDMPDPPDLYGRSKLLGEVTGDNCLTIRTSFFGLSAMRNGLVEWLLQQQGKTIQGYTRYVFSGLPAITLSRLIADIIERDPPLTGLYHVGGHPISKYDLLLTLAQTLEVNVTIEPTPVPNIDRSLDSSRFWEIMQLPVPTLQQMADELRRVQWSI